MSPYIHVKCSCGREVRAKVEQAGTTVRCWGCGRAVVVPMVRTGGQLAAAFSDAARDVFRSDVLARICMTALVGVAVLNVPVAGAWIGFALLVAAAWLYQG